MKFADTAYFLALLNPDDEFHATALAWGDRLDETVLTTMWVLAEVGDAMHRGRNRQAFGRLLDTLHGHEDFEIAPASPESFASAVTLFRARPDKEWSLTDCSSFVMMRERGLTEALTTDHHFEQAGFRALLREG